MAWQAKPKKAAARKKRLRMLPNLPCPKQQTVSKKLASAPAGICAG